MRALRTRIGRRALCAAAVSAALGVASAVDARPPGPPRGGPHDGGRFIERHADRLGLDEAARAAITEISDATREREAELREQLDAAYDALRAALDAESPDEASVMQRAEEIHALELESHRNRLAAMLKIRSLLTPEQRRELIAIRGERERRRAHHGWRQCRDDLDGLCGERDGRERLACAADHWDALSDGCRSAFERAPSSAGHRGPPPPPAD